MKDSITRKQAEKLATADKSDVDRWIEYVSRDWITEHAQYIAAIELKTTPDRTYWGLFPDGWRKALKAHTRPTAVKELTDRYIKQHCQVIDGVIWLADLRTIEQMEGKTA